ncbi:Lipoprotein LipO precursor [compost metagenome]
MLHFFDRTMDKDVANLMMYGIEGRHYKLENGKVILPENTSQLRVNEVSPLYSLMIADISNKNILEVAQKEQLTALADQLSQDNEQFLVDDPTITLSSPTYDEKNVELSTIIVDATYNYIIGNISAEDFNEEVEEWKAGGGAMIMQEYTEAAARAESAR